MDVEIKPILPLKKSSIQYDWQNREKKVLNADLWDLVHPAENPRYRVDNKRTDKVKSEKQTI